MEALSLPWREASFLSKPNGEGYVFDRREGVLCVLTRGDETLTLPFDALPQDAREGDTLVHTAAGWRIDEEATAARRARIDGLMARLFEKK